MAPLYFLPSLISPQIPPSMVSHSLLRRANGTSPNPILNPNNADQSSLQNITFGIIGIFFALGSFVLAYLQYRRSIQSPSHAPGLDETENTISFGNEFPAHILPSLPSASRTTSDEFAATRNPPIPLPARGLTLQNLTGSRQEQNTATDSSTTPVDLVESESTSVPRAPLAEPATQPFHAYQTPSSTLLPHDNALKNPSNKPQIGLQGG